MGVRAIHADLLRAWIADPGSARALNDYVQTHRPLLEAYDASFGPGGDVVEDYRHRWSARVDEARALVARLRDLDPTGLALAGLRAAIRLLHPRQEPEVVLLVGLGYSNACQLVVGGRPVVAISLEAWGGEFFGAYLPWDDLPLWVAHECAHVVRYTEGACAVRDFIAREGFDYRRALAALPLREFLADEGLATAVAEACCPEAEPERVLGFSAEVLAWCRRHEVDLWAEVAPRLDSPLGEEGYARYFSAGGGDLPPRTGYYLGWRMVKSYLERHPGVGLDAAVRVQAEAFVTANA
ncbi:MAG: DUF2268 domain-containing putative Zn-dependent protease [Bacillota bacterium]